MTNENNYERQLHYSDYSTGHPWYYFLGGKPPRPRQILESVRACGYGGYNIEAIEKADRKAEPQRSEALRLLREEELKHYKSDLSRYRQLAFQLSQLPEADEVARLGVSCSDIHTNISLKHNHLFNRLAHLVQIKKRLNRQPDLFA